MKFEKSVYKSAMDKIDNPQKRKSKEQDIDQKYKADVLSGKINDSLAGWNGDSAYYDTEMIKHECRKKMARCLVLLAVGVIVLILLWPYLTDTMYLKYAGVKQRAYYGWSVDFHEYGYIYRWTYVDGEEVPVDNVGQDGITKEEAERLDELEEQKDVKMFRSFSISKDVFLVTKWDEKGAKVLNAEIENGVGETKALRKAIEKGVEPIDNYIYVELNDYVFMSGKKGEYIDLYYLPQEGETYLDSRIIFDWGFELTMIVILLIYNGIWIGRLIKLGMEERTLK